MTLDLTDNKLAIIYCRVSSKGQTGLGSQEHRCRQYATEKGYKVVAAFDDDVSGGGDFIKRQGMVDLLGFLDKHIETNFIVIFDDLKRYARDVEFHLKLRRLMAERGAIRECLNFTFEDTPEGQFTEVINAAVGELDRKQTARQNRQKSIARLEQGYAVFNQLPIGYKYVKVKGGNSEAVRDEPLASIVQEALEGYATGRFGSQVEVKRFLESQPEFPKHFADGTIRQQKVVDMLNQHMYAGYISAPKWGVSIRDAKHEGLISKASFEAVQQRLKGGVYAPARKDIREDFPLRGAICCSECNAPLTAGWCKGKYKKYPYYFCHMKGCVQKGKTISKDKLEGEFETLLQKLVPQDGLFKVASAMFKDYWNQTIEKSSTDAKAFKQQVAKIEKTISQLVERIVNTDNIKVIDAYEKRMENLEREKLILREKATKTGVSQKSYGEMFELSMKFLSNPWKIWRYGNFDLQRLVLKLAFTAPLSYNRNEGCLNSNFSLPFKALGDFCTSENVMVPLGRIELPASPLPMVRSTTELQRPEGMRRDREITLAAPIATRAQMMQEKLSKILPGHLSVSPSLHNNR